MSTPQVSYREDEEFPGTIGATYEDSAPAWLEQRSAEGAPNVVVVLIDDLGYAQLGCYGGLGGRIRTPHIDRLAAGGLRYSDFHVAPMCSPTRAALLTGRNHHSVGVGALMELLTGYPGYDGRLAKDTAMLPAVLSDAGYVTWALGKWHLTPTPEVNPAGPMDRWPLRQGFDRFYGFMPAQTDQYRPSLWEDNHHLGYPDDPDGSYHLTEDLVDRAIALVAERDACAPDRPFFLYLAPGAMHQPHQVAPEWSDRFRGAFSAGWDVIREETLAHQKALGVVPEGTELPPPNPGVRPWADLGERERELFERQMEVYAGFLEHTDHQIGRLLTELDRRGELDDTIVILMSDNGVSGEGTPQGMRGMTLHFNGAEETFEELYADLDTWGDASHSPHYSIGWSMAGATPNRWYKRFTHEGGTRAPMIVHWPAGIDAAGEIRRQFHHVVDVMPTVLEAARVPVPTHVRGYEQRPLEGTSFRYSFDDGAAKSRKRAQYFEMLGHRAIWSDGWKAVQAHLTSEVADLFFPDRRDLVSEALDSGPWELYHLEEDFAENHDLAARHPDKLAELIELWEREATAYRVRPLDDRFLERYRLGRAAFGRRHEFVYYGPIRLPAAASPGLVGVSHRITADITVAEDSRGGVIVSDGADAGGYALGIADGHVVFGMNRLGRDLRIARTAERIEPGRQTVTVLFDADEPRSAGERALGGTATLTVAGCTPVRMRVDGVNPVRYDTTAEGIRVGCDVNGVLPHFPRPAIFDGEIHEVRITREDTPRRDAAADAAAALAEQ